MLRTLGVALSEDRDVHTYMSSTPPSDRSRETRQAGSPALPFTQKEKGICNLDTSGRKASTSGAEFEGISGRLVKHTSTC